MIRAGPFVLKILESSTLHVAKSGDKLGIWIPKSPIIGKLPRSAVRIAVRNQLGQASFMALAPGWATIPSRIRRDLSIRHGQCLSLLEVKRVEHHSRKDFNIKDGKADLLSFIPDATNKGYPLYVDEHEEAGVSWLSVWYYHPRGAARQIELKRYVNVSRIGQLLGQLQAEGNKKGPSIVFKNSSISEHADFVTALRELGVSPPKIHGRCIFNPNRSSPREVRQYSKKYKSATGMGISYFDETPKMKGAIAADTLVRSTILTRILLFAMDEVRSGTLRNELLRQNFLAKLLSGDGTLDARETPKRLDVRITIVDQNVEYLRDYAAILYEEGFKARVRPESLSVRAYCTWLNLLKLYEIGAFRNSKNWTKLLCSIMIEARGRVNRGYRRILELSSLRTITSLDVCVKYAIGRRAANLWLNRMRRLGLIKWLPRIPRGMHNRYSVTSRGKEICEILNAVEGEFCEISYERKMANPNKILEIIKEKKFRSAKKCPEPG